MALLDAVKAFFQAESWAFDEAEDEPVLRLGFVGETGRWVCLVLSDEERQQIVFYSLVPTTAAKARVPDVAELFHRINFGLSIGGFEVDYDSGKMRFRTSVDVEDAEPSVALVRNLSMANVATVDAYLPAIEALLGGESVEKALGHARL